MKILKKISTIFLIIIMFVFTYAPVYAVEGGGGTGSGSGGTGGVGVGGDEWYEWGESTYAGRPLNPGAYRVQLVYKPQDSARYVIADAVVQSPNYAGGTPSNPNYYYRDTMIRLANDYANRKGIKYINSGALVDLIEGVETTSIDSNAKLTENAEIDRYIQAFADAFPSFSEGDLTLPQDENPGRYESYGYRILIQRLTLFAYGDINYPTWLLSTRQDAINENMVSLPGGDYDMWSLFGAGASREIYTTVPDIGIAQSNKSYNVNNTDPNNFGYNRSCLSSDVCGDGYNIIWFSTRQYTQNNYDYSIDAACVNCYAKNYDNRSYIIQDITDWDAIMNSATQTSVPNAVNYYDKGNGVFCREEFLIEYPDANNYVTTYVGRYFLINATAEEETMVTNSNPVNGANINFKPIRVTRTRECRSSTNNIGALTNFELNSRSTFLDNAGTITLKYTENKEDSRYDTTIELESKTYYHTDSDKLTSSELLEKGYSSSIENNTLTMKQTLSYSLPDNVYRYIRKSDGVSMFKISGISESDLKEKYIDMGISTLPVSFNSDITEHYTDDDYNVVQLGSIQLQYELPKADQYSKIANAYTINNDYFKSSEDNSKIDNIYKKYVNGEIGADDAQLKQSACAKLYGNTNSSGFNTCATARVDNKIGAIIGNSNYNCITKNTFNDISENDDLIGYTCPIMTQTPPGDKDNPKCKIEIDSNGNNIYYGINGDVVTEGQYNSECNDDPSENPSEKICQIVNNVYYGINGDIVTPAVYHMQCEEKYDCDIVTDANGNITYYGINGDIVTQARWEKECLMGPQCSYENGIYYGKNGQVLNGYNEWKDECDVDPNPGDKPDCNEENGGDRWNPDEGVCCPKGQTYNEETGMCHGIPEEIITDGDTCYVENGVYYGAQGQVCSKAQWYSECHPEIGGIKVIYRPIDLTIPFPGQDAEGNYRNTGSNWCAYINGVYDCSYNNPLASQVVIDDRSYTYSGTPMYSVTLDTDKINYIRNYNNDHQYDDFELNCTNGKACLSDFLELSNLEVTYRSGCHSSSNFYSTSCLGSDNS